MSSDDITIGSVITIGPGIGEGYPVYANGKGSLSGSKRLGTQLLRSVQDAKIKSVIRILPDVLPGRVSDKNIGNHELRIELNPGWNPDFFTQPHNANDPKTNVRLAKAPFSILLGHELVHVSHYVRRSSFCWNSEKNTFYDEWGTEFVETPPSEELLTVGLGAFNTKNNTLTENGLRAEHQIPRRVSYAVADGTFPGQGAKHTGSQPPAWWDTYPVNCYRASIRIFNIIVIHNQNTFGWGEAKWKFKVTIGGKTTEEFRDQVVSGNPVAVLVIVDAYGGPKKEVPISIVAGPLGTKPQDLDTLKFDNFQTDRRDHRHTKQPENQRQGLVQGGARDRRYSQEVAHQQQLSATQGFIDLSLGGAPAPTPRSQPSGPGFPSHPRR